MVATTFLKAAIVGAAVVSAVPTTKIGTTSNTFGAGRASVKQVKRKGDWKPNGALSIFKTYLKYNVEIPDYLVVAVANSTGVDYATVKARSTGSAVTTPSDSYDDAYLTPVSIGTPAQVLNLDFDTGSSDLWVFSSLTAAADVNGQAIYTPTKSSTAKLVSGATWDISYGDGSSSSGVVYTDVVDIGGLSVSNQGVEAAKTVSSSFTAESDLDGLVGLGFDALNTVSPTAQKTFWSNALASLDEPVFTADLKHQAPGTYNFGYIDDSLYTGSITYVPVTKTPGYWKFTSSGYGVGSTYTSTSTVGIADTGTTLLYLPAAIVRAYYAEVSGASNSLIYGGWVFSCSATLPTFTFGVGTSKIVIPAEYMNYGEANTAGTVCYGGLQSSASIGINIYGDVALKSAFVVFNAETPSLGWAAKTL